MSKFVASRTPEQLHQRRSVVEWLHMPYTPTVSMPTNHCEPLGNITAVVPTFNHYILRCTTYYSTRYVCSRCCRSGRSVNWRGMMGYKYSTVGEWLLSYVLKWPNWRSFMKRCDGMWDSFETIIRGHNTGGLLGSAIVL